MVCYALKVIGLAMALVGANLLGGSVQEEGGAPSPAGQTATAWNDFTVEGFPPSSNEVAAHLATTAQESEKTTCEARLRRALAPALVTPDLRNYLLPLRGWEGNNVFVTRSRSGEYWVQVTEGAARVDVEVRRVDGGPALPPGADPFTVAVDVAERLLSSTMQPRELHRVDRDPPRCACWTTLDQPGPGSFVIAGAEAYADATSVRYRLYEEVHTSQVYPGVPLYTFAPPPPPPPPPPEAPWPEPIPQDLHGFPGSVPLEGEVN